MMSYQFIAARTIAGTLLSSRQLCLLLWFDSHFPFIPLLRLTMNNFKANERLCRLVHFFLSCRTDGATIILYFTYTSFKLHAQAGKFSSHLTTYFISSEMGKRSQFDLAWKTFYYRSHLIRLNARLSPEVLCQSFDLTHTKCTLQLKRSYDITHIFHIYLSLIYYYPYIYY